MSPYEAKMLLHYATELGDYRDGHTKGKVRREVEEAMALLGLIEARPEGSPCRWVITERGRALVALMCSVEAAI